MRTGTPVKLPPLLEPSFIAISYRLQFETDSQRAGLKFVKVLLKF